FETATTQGSNNLSLHDALPISADKMAATWRSGYAADCKSAHAGSIPAVASTNPAKSVLSPPQDKQSARRTQNEWAQKRAHAGERSEEHTSELQSRENHVCRLLL